MIKRGEGIEGKGSEGEKDGGGKKEVREGAGRRKGWSKGREKEVKGRRSWDGERVEEKVRWE